MRGLRVVFPEVGRAEVEDFAVPAVGPHQVLVRTEASLISAGTELTGYLNSRSPVLGHPYNPWTQTRNRLAFLELLQERLVGVDHLITHRVPPTDASKVYEMVRAGGSDWLGIVFEWDKSS
jgi:threonine dehydrogenase-like Zn-dependent dehydrogenase